PVHRSGIHFFCFVFSVFICFGTACSVCALRLPCPVLCDPAGCYETLFCDDGRSPGGKATLLASGPLEASRFVTQHTSEICPVCLVLKQRVRYKIWRPGR
ncbi:unnamed protein product, partial [Ectocarpus sp. 13 AM-2016]